MTERSQVLDLATLRSGGTSVKVNYLDIALEHVQILERAKPPSKLWIASIVHSDFKGLLYIKHHEIHRLFNGGGVLLPMSVDDCYEQLSLNLEQTGGGSFRTVR